MEKLKRVDKPIIVSVESVSQETPTVRTITITSKYFAKALPGQFAMVWIPGKAELPMSVMVSMEENKAAFTVRKYGKASTALYNLLEGDQIGLRGLYGNSFDIRSGRLLLVGGGTGLVPLMRLTSYLKRTDEVTFLIGAKTKDEVFFEDMADKIMKKVGYGGEIIVSTEDGSYGKKGLVTDLMDSLFARENGGFDAVYTCGPEKMMYKVVQKAEERDIYTQASLERMMKCGIGICGSCCMDDLLVCHDGTVFDGKKLRSSKEFGVCYRNKSGTIEYY